MTSSIPRPSHRTGPRVSFRIGLARTIIRRNNITSFSQSLIPFHFLLPVSPKPDKINHDTRTSFLTRFENYYWPFLKIALCNVISNFISTPVWNTRNFFFFLSMPVSLAEKNNLSLKSPGLKFTTFIYITTQKLHIDIQILAVCGMFVT